MVSPVTGFPSGASALIEVTKAAAILPQTGDGTLFTVSGGRVILASIVGEVTTVIETQANASLIKINPTVGADVDLCAALDITADAVGTIYTITGTLGDVMAVATSGAIVHQAAPLILAVGVIELECAASNTGAIKWTLKYLPYDDGAIVS